MFLQQTTFEKLVAKEEIALDYYTFTYRELPYFCLNDFKVVCCRFVVREKGLTQLVTRTS